MRKGIVGISIAAGAVAVTGVAVAGTVQFRATATGAEEVPVRATTAEATLKLKVHDDQTVTYDLKVTEPIEDVFMAHLHRADPGVNGPIGVWLFPHPAPVLPPGTFAPEIPGSFEGRLAKDTIVPADLCFSPTAPWCANGVPQWEAFVADIEAGHVYVNLHTVEFRGGEIRSQVHNHPDHDA